MSIERSSFEDFENNPEKFPSQEEVKTAFEKLIGEEDYTETRRLEDDKGLYLWEIETENFEYSYMRKGKYPEGEASHNQIFRVEYESGRPVGGKNVARYENGEWEFNT